MDTDIDVKVQSYMQLRAEGHVSSRRTSTDDALDKLMFPWLASTLQGEGAFHSCRGCGRHVSLPFDSIVFLQDSTRAALGMCPQTSVR